MCRPTSAEWGRAEEWKQGPRAGEKERDFAVGETKAPGDLRGDVIANAGREDAARGAEKCAGASLWFGDHLRFEFPLGRRFTLPPCTHRVSAAAVLADGAGCGEQMVFRPKGQAASGDSCDRLRGSRLNEQTPPPEASATEALAKAVHVATL